VVARSKYFHAFSSPSSAIESAGGLNGVGKEALDIVCVKASMPVPAREVRAAG